MAQNVYDETIPAPAGWRTLKKGEPIPQRHRFYTESYGWCSERACHSTSTPENGARVSGNVIAYAAPNMRHQENPDCSCSCNHISESCYNRLLEEIKQKDKFIAWQSRLIESLTNVIDAASQNIQSVSSEIKKNFKL
jgi:hypothetical protein